MMKPSDKKRDFKTVLFAYSTDILAFNSNKTAFSSHSTLFFTIQKNSVYSWWMGIGILLSKA